MAGIGQSSTPSSDQSTSWNSQLNMGRLTNIDNYSNKYLPNSEKKRAEENGVLPQTVYQYNRQPTGFQSSNLVSTDKVYMPNMQSNMANQMTTGNSSTNYSMYQRPVGGDSNIFPFVNTDLLSQSKQGFNASTRLGGMSQFLDSSNHQHIPPTLHRPISSGGMNPNVPVFNGQTISKNRPGTYNFDSNSISCNSQWDTHIGTFDSNEFPTLKSKQNTLLNQMSSMGNYNYNFPNKSFGPINYQTVTKSGIQIVSAEPPPEFIIQQEDFPALPVAHNPITCVESQRSSSASGVNAPVALYSGDNSSQSHNSSIIDATDFIGQKTYPSSCSLDCPPDQGQMMMPLQQSISSTITNLSSINNSSQLHNKVQKKISKGPNNYIANIPKDMVSDAFGLIGLVKLLSINDSYDNLNLLAPGLETLSLNRELDSTKDIYHSYVSPLSSNCAGRPHDMDYQVPKEYRIRHMIINRLAEPLPEKLSDDTLFWIFYNLSGEECQLVAARQLMLRQWRYHKRERFWLTRDPNGAETITYSNFEQGSYIIWDYEKAKRISKSFAVYYRDLENVLAPTNMKLKLPFLFNYGGAMKRQGPSSSMMLPPGVRPVGSNVRGNKTLYQQPQQQSFTVVGTDSCWSITGPDTVAMTSSSSFTEPSSSLMMSQGFKFNNNGSQSQQQLHHMMPIPSPSSSLAMMTITTTTPSTSLVNAVTPQ